MKYKYILNKENKSFKGLLINIKKYFIDSSLSIHKARNEIKIIDYEANKLVVKSFKIPHLLNKIVYTFLKDSKAQKSYDNSVRIIEFVPKPIGYIEFKKYGLIDESYFVSEHFNFDFTIREPLLEENFLEREKVFREFAKFTYELHQNNIFHLDYSPGNILIKKDGDSFIFKIVDINRMQFKKLSLEDRLKNFSKLWAKDEYLTIIIDEYSKIMNENRQICLDTALKYSQSHKDAKNFKKRLKGQKIVD